MKMTLNELRQMVNKIVLDEAKKKKPKDEPKLNDATKKYGSYSEAFDFSSPLGSLNLYMQQGQSNFGPYTATANEAPMKESKSPSSLVESIESTLSEESSWSPVDR